MSQSPYYFVSSGVLDTTSARRRVPLNYPPPESCVAPKDIFFDYDVIMSSMRRTTINDVESLYDDDEIDELDDDGADFSTDESSPKTPYSPQLEDDELCEDDDDDDYSLNHSKPRAVPRTSRKMTKIQKQDTTRSNYTDIKDSEQRCTYIDPEDRRRCNKVNRSSQEAARHWRSCHLYKEGKAMLLGTLPVGRGTAITSKKQLDEIRPRIECQRCGALITRSDAMRRHLKTNCR
ncbi:hypothetical protein Clacol_006077 [Clathrus columnatus]|uniref:C2H2-type domain-containing protein n=1 Tax=Clathrus columnatus TaxID=1419009 RepID=A0AAV5AF78_9AGAM|nr:hypothetical protein Clacol_006077 [Clathrus columnatus]